MIEAPSMYQIALPAMVAIAGTGAILLAKIAGRRVDARIHRHEVEAAKPHVSTPHFDIAEHVTTTIEGPRAVRPSKTRPVVIAVRKFRFTHGNRRYSRSQGRA